MVGFNDFLTQILQPYFFYSIVFLLIAAICVKVFLKFNPQLSKAQQSIAWLIPLIIPAFVYLVFYPQATISVSSINQLQLPNASSSIALFWRSQTSIFSVTGYLCIVGAILAAGYFVVSFIFGRRIAMKAFHVVLMYPEEFVPVQEKVKEVSKKIGVAAPKVGLIDDLRPNAFTLGYGRGAMIVFSLGLLNMLSTEELTAVISHELSHVKAKDYIFRSISYTLNVLTFFNPISYFAASEVQKKRELLADENGAALLSQPTLMANVLTKLDKALQSFPREPFVGRLSTSLFLISPLARRPEILAAHPQINHRVHNINTFTSKPPAQKTRRKKVLAIIAILVVVSVLSGYWAVQVQTNFQTHQVFTVNNHMSGNHTIILNASLQNGNLLQPNINGLANLNDSSHPQLHVNFPEGSKIMVVNGDGAMFSSNSSSLTQLRYIIEDPAK